MRDGISMARGNNGVIMRALLAPVISRGTLILVQTFIQTVMTFLFRSKSVVESLSVFSPPSSLSSSSFSLFLEKHRRWRSDIGIILRTNRSGKIYFRFQTKLVKWWQYKNYDRIIIFSLPKEQISNTISIVNLCWKKFWSKIGLRTNVYHCDE